MDSLKSFPMVWKVYGLSEKCLNGLGSFQIIWKVSENLESFRIAWKISGESGKFQDNLESLGKVWKVSESVCMVWEVSRPRETSWGSIGASMRSEGVKGYVRVVPGGQRGGGANVSQSINGHI